MTSSFTLDSFHITNYKGIKSCAMHNLPANAKWIFLTGENGYGKTSILQALSIALYGFEGHTYSYQNASKNCSFKIVVNPSSTKQKLTFDPVEFPTKTFPKLTCYGSTRLDMAIEGKMQNDSPTISLFESRTLLRNIESQLSRWYFKQNIEEFKEKYNSVTKLLTQLLTLKKITVDPKTDTVYYYEKDQQNQQYEKLPSKYLASGYRSIIGMVGDLILRLFEQQEGINKVEDLEGIVIIDELDLHFHPKWQRKLPSLLSKIFPKLYFIVSTHSAIPLLGAPPHSIILNVQRNTIDGITVERLTDMEKQLSNLLPNIILSSPIFGLQDLFPVTHHGNKRIQTADSYEEMKMNELLENQLKSFEGSDKEKALLNLFKPKDKNS